MKPTNQPIDRDALVDISTVKINPALPRNQRIADYIRQIRNPYCYLSGGVVVHILDEGEANCVIVKDMSRFGREYIQSGRYLQRIFPEKGIRFIAINDGRDFPLTVAISPIANADNGDKRATEIKT